VAIRQGRGFAWARGKFEGLRACSAARVQNLQGNSEVLGQVLRSNEQFIHSASRDRYWALYFLLTGGAK
jgi:uncharacterized protein (DUF2132 family)